MTPAASDRTADSGGVQSVDRAVTVLEILARSGGSGVTEVAAELGVHKSTAFRLLGALEDRDLVEQAGDRGKYHLGFGILRLAGAVPGQLDLVRQGRPVLDALAVEFGETVNLAVIRSHYAVNVDQALGSAAVTAHNWVGELTPLHATSSGKVLLAYLPIAERRRLLRAAGQARFTPHTITTRSGIEAQAERVVTDGYASTLQEYEDGLNAVAAPVRDHAGAVIAAISVSGPAYRLTATAIAAATAPLIAGADRLSARLGHLG